MSGAEVATEVEEVKLVGASPLRRSTRAPKGRGKGRGSASNAEASGLPAPPKVQKLTLKSKVLKDIGGRDISEVAAEARARVAAAESVIKEAEGSETVGVREKDDLKLQVEQTSKAVADLAEKEAAALRSLKEVCKAHLDIQKETADLRETLLENQEVILFLELHKAKAMSRDATGAAKEAIAEQKRLEKEAMRAASKDHNSRGQHVADELLVDTSMSENTLKLNSKTKVKYAKKEMDDLLKGFDRIRQQRLKRRAGAKSKTRTSSKGAGQGSTVASPNKRARNEVADVD